MSNENISLTPVSLKLFLDYANDSWNWAGTPLVDGNISGSKELRGNLTNLKKNGLIETFRNDGCTWIQFTEKGVEFAKSHGVEVCSSNF